MPKIKQSYLCEHCQEILPKWSGQCPACKTWNTVVEQKPEVSPLSASLSGGKILSFSDKNSNTQNTLRVSTGIHEVDRVLGGGFFPDALTLLTGNPGIGKSTLALQVAIHIAQHTSTSPVLVFTGEESPSQVMQRATRLGGDTKNLHVTSAYHIEDVVLTTKKHAPSLIIVDSVQTFTSHESASSAGSLPQIRAVTEQLMHLAKTHQVPVLLIGQVNKDGEMAGPQVLAHLVDTVLFFEGDDQHDLRILRANKNRFGSTSEVGIFEMTSSGLKEVKNPSAAFLSGRLLNGIGSTIFPATEGQRPCLVEIQALVAPSPFGFPKRSASGISLQRLGLLLAVLEKHAGITLSSRDVFANVVGGIRIEEPASDLALCLSLASSHKKIPIPSSFIAMGEVGLSGEIRAVSHLEQRLNEGEKLGFTSAIIPKTVKIPKTSLRLFPVTRVVEAIEAVFGRVEK